MIPPARSSSVDVQGLALLPSPTVATLEVEHEAILVDEDGGQSFALNPSAALFWACLDGVSPVRDICRDLSEGLEVPYERVAADIEPLVRNLLDVRLATASGYELPEPGIDRGPGCGCSSDDDGGPHASGEVVVDPRWVREPPNT